MFKVYVGNNTDRWPVNVTPDTVLRDLLEEQHIDFTRSTLHLNGSALRPGDVDKTFMELGVTGERDSFLLAMQKLDNARA